MLCKVDVFSIFSHNANIQRDNTRLNSNSNTTSVIALVLACFLSFAITTTQARIQQHVSIRYDIQQSLFNISSSSHHSSKKIHILDLLADPLLSTTSSDSSTSSDSISIQCSNDLYNLTKLKYPSSFEILEASGKGFWDLGNYDNCLSLPSNVSQYCAISTPRVVTLAGLCLPCSCSESDVGTALEMVMNKTGMTTYLVEAGIGSVFTVHCYSGDHLTDRPPMTAGPIIMIILCLVIALFVVAGTLIEYLLFTRISIAKRYEDEYNTNEEWNLLVNDKSKDYKSTPINYQEEMNQATTIQKQSGAPFNFTTDIYQKPWTRVGPYAVGIAMAMIFDQTRQSTNPIIHAIKTWPVVRYTFYVVALGTTTFFTFIPYNAFVGDGWSTLQNALFNACGHTGFVLGAGLFLLTAFAGRGGLVAWLLERPIFKNLSKLTYSTYLIHPIVISSIAFSRVTLFHYKTVNDAASIISNIVFAFTCAFIVHLTIEKPCINLEKLLFHPKPSSSSTKYVLLN
ncbi:hypothetical protein DFA_10223 [Cavenderia fasciculata]|uniref:Acyltransferase 3 domain-containing protein n=1 Tax=Cavenderia fasciculata TaxID=261658 RepID=F4Q9M0_CACFS|nr:uncharacterized protein DFA_10223 [Cavenderia fasciculata]EGG15389.1 hypothetical protein DFA_10223 [Cavenderia fasciculata]|eukprot:XP_004354131.1 hypothetical protein DFA_10223 [Cavenderia fasciculata]